MTPMSATIVLIIISVIVLFIKHIFNNQALSDQYSFLKLNLLYTIPVQYQPQPQQFFNSLYQSYTKTPMNSKKVTIIQGQYQHQPLHTAAQNDVLLVSCGQHYTIFMENGVKEGVWLSRIGLYMLPYMKQLQVMSIPGKLQMQLKMQCKPFQEYQGYLRSTGYTLTYAIQQAPGWAIYTLKILTQNVQPIYPRHFHSEPILTAIPSKPLAISVSERRNIYVYTTQDTPWVLEIQSIQHQFSYKRSSSRIDIVANGARIYSHYGSYKATTFGKFKQKWDDYQQGVQNKTQFKFASKYKRATIIIPYQIIISRSGNRVTYVYQHKNHPYCSFNILMRSTWNIAAINHHSKFSNILYSKDLDLYLKSAPQYRYGHNSEAKPKNYHENTAADIIGSVYEQASEFIVDCELVYKKKSLYAESQSILCAYLIKGNHYLNIVRLGNYVFPLPTEKNYNGSYRQQKKQKNNQLQDCYFTYLNQKNSDNQALEVSLNATQENSSQNIGIPKVTFYQTHVVDMPRKSKSVSMEHLYFPLPNQTSALNFNKIKILTMNGTSTNPIIFLQANHFSDQSYVFTCQLNGTNTIHHKFFDIKGKFFNVLKHYVQKDLDAGFQRRLDFRVVEANYIDQKIVLMWGFGIQIYQLEDERVYRQKFQGVPMDYFLPLVELFAIVFCMFQALLSTNA